jgi:hypothetical protein
MGMVGSDAGVEIKAQQYEIVRMVTVLHALITFRARGIGSELGSHRGSPRVTRSHALA